jgi:DNA-directed RNA polymerase I subunit RPA1
MLRIKCLNCHKLAAPARTLEVFKVKFQLLQHSRYSEVLELDDRMAAAMKQHRGEPGEKKNALSIHSAGLAIDNVLSDIVSSLETNDSRPQHRLSTYEEAHHRDLVKELISTCKSAKSCPHCGAFSPRIRQDSSNKIFQSPLSATAKRMNEAEGITIEPALSKGDSSDDGDQGESTGYDSDDSNPGGKGPSTEGSDSNEQESTRDRYMHPAEVKAQVKRTWETNSDLCSSLLAAQGCDIFFMQAIPVPPNRFRPPMHLGGMIVEHAQNIYLNKMMTSNELIRSNFAAKSEATAYKHWIDLQTHMNCYMDSSKDPSLNNQAPGIRQLLERKEGIFRKHMMGKRVNFACRSVISPDPYIGTNEIGIPRHFAVNLTYPTPVTDINIEEMRTLVERGPDQYPGARWVEFPERRVDLSKMDDHKREAVAARLLTYAKKGGRPAIVGRQMKDGDMVLMNRQVCNNYRTRVVLVRSKEEAHCHAPL